MHTDILRHPVYDEQEEDMKRCLATFQGWSDKGSENRVYDCNRLGSGFTPPFAFLQALPIIISAFCSDHSTLLCHFSHTRIFCFTGSPKPHKGVADSRCVGVTDYYRRLCRQNRGCLLLCYFFFSCYRSWLPRKRNPQRTATVGWYSSSSFLCPG